MIEDTQTRRRTVGRDVGAALRLAALAVALASAGCTAISDSGPSRRDVETRAAATIGPTQDRSLLDYALVDLNRGVLPLIDDPGPGSLLRTFGAGHKPPPAVVVGVGDTVQVTLFEAQSGGLFIPVDAGARPGNFVTLPNQTVDSRGYISVPYAGQIAVLNRSTPAIQREIVEKLKNRAIEPQAVVTLVNQSSMQFTVLGDVNTPGKLTVNAAGDKVLDAISRSGGIRNPGYEEFVTLQRNGMKSTVYFMNLVKEPRENVYRRVRRHAVRLPVSARLPRLRRHRRQRPVQVSAGEPDPQRRRRQGGRLARQPRGPGRGPRLSPGEACDARSYGRRPLGALRRTGRRSDDLSRQPARPFGVLRRRAVPDARRRRRLRRQRRQVEIAKFLGMLTSFTSSASGMASDAANAKAAILYLQNRCGPASCP